MFAWLTPRFATLDEYPCTREIPMVQTDFRTALQGSNEIEITVTGRRSGRSLSYPVWFVLEGDKLYLLPVRDQIPTGTKTYSRHRPSVSRPMGKRQPRAPHRSPTRRRSSRW